MIYFVSRTLTSRVIVLFQTEMGINVTSDLKYMFNPLLEYQTSQINCYFEVKSENKCNSI